MVIRIGTRVPIFVPNFLAGVHVRGRADAFRLVIPTDMQTAVRVSIRYRRRVLFAMSKRPTADQKNQADTPKK
jgi:hypothetical protein